MNDRIKKLAEEAGLGQERWNSTEQFNAFLEEFAELIVGECAVVADYFYSRNDCVSGRNIKKHFGVE
jgi:hypothetical protein